MINELTSQVTAADLPGGQARICMITSAKGGVGKSTVCANLGMALAMRGKRVLLLDCDESNCCLDLMLGMEDRVCFGLSDVLMRHTNVENVILPHPAMPSLALIPGAHASDPAEDLFSSDRFAALIRTLSEGSEKGAYDVILIDTPGGVTHTLRCVAKTADEALIVSSPQITSIRSAEKTASLLSREGLKEQKLIINLFSHGKTKKVQQENEVSLIGIVDSVALPLFGVVPYDETIWEKQNKGLLINAPEYSKTAFQHAFLNTAARFCNESVPLFSKKTI